MARYTRSKGVEEGGAAEVLDDGREEGVNLAILVVGSMEDAGAGRLWVQVGYVE